MLEISLELPGKFLLIVLFQLFLHNGNNLRDFIVLVSPKLGVDFSIAVVASVKIDKTLKCSVSIIFEFIMSIFALSHIGHLFNHVRHDICD
jgi:hypothetical protein